MGCGRSRIGCHPGDLGPRRRATVGAGEGGANGFPRTSQTSSPRCPRSTMLGSSPSERGQASLASSVTNPPMGHGGTQCHGPLVGVLEDGIGIDLASFVGELEMGVGPSPLGVPGVTDVTDVLAGLDMTSHDQARDQGQRPVGLPIVRARVIVVQMQIAGRPSRLVLDFDVPAGAAVGVDHGDDALPPPRRHVSSWGPSDRCPDDDDHPTWRHRMSTRRPSPGRPEGSRGRREGYSRPGPGSLGPWRRRRTAPTASGSERA